MLRSLKSALYGSVLERVSYAGVFPSETGYELPLYRLHPVLATPRLALPTHWLRRTASAEALVARIRELAALADRPLKDCRVLEIGGGFAPMLAGIDRDLVALRTVTDIQEYYGDAQIPELEATLRAQGIGFVWDDICASWLDDASADIIICRDVLEHVGDPAAFFRETRRILAPGGVLNAAYNPFFAINGGHSPCTTMGYWGHALLTDTDMERYFRKYHADSVDARMHFLTRALNRLTLADAAALAQAHGYESVEYREFDEPGLRPAVTPPVLAQLRRLHPSATADDLVTKSVQLTLRAGS